MFHVKQFINYLSNLKIHELLFYVFLFLVPIQTRILYNPSSAYISWYFNNYLAFFVYASDLILFVCFITWFWSGDWKQKPNRLFWLTLAFLGAILISLFHVKQENLAYYGLIKWVELLFLMFYVHSTFRQSYQFKLSAGVLFLAVLMQSLIGLVQFHVQHGIGLAWLGEYIAPAGTPGLATIQFGSEKLIRAYGTFPHPNVYGAFLVLGLILGLFLVSRGTSESRIKSGMTKILMTLGLILITWGIFVSFSRLAWVAAILAILCYLVYYWRNQRATFNRLCLVILVSCATIGILGNQYLKARALDSSSVSVSDRVYFDKLGVELIKQHPIIGAGAGNYVPALQILEPNLEPWQYQPAHNIFIFLGAELGLLGLAIFLAMLSVIFWSARKVPCETLSLSVILLGLLFLLMGQFDHYFVTIQQGRLMLFVVLGLLASLPNLYKVKSEFARSESDEAI